VSVPNIQQGSQDISAFYLPSIYQQLSTQPDGSQTPIPSSLSDPTQPFTPPTLGVWVNGLWVMSLVISLTCALLATLLQQWARRYKRVAYPRYNPHKRARIRAFYKHGVEKLRIPWMVEAALLHISLFLFFAGLSVFLFGVDLTNFKVVASWIALYVILYACLTFLPVIREDSPYSAPPIYVGLFLFHWHTISFLPSSSEVPRNRSLHLHAIAQSCPPLRLLFVQHDQDGGTIRPQNAPQY
jgi:hypothetical protein